MAFEHFRIKTQHTQRHVPFGMPTNFAFYLRQHAKRIVVLHCGVTIQPSKGHDVPVIVADAHAGENLLPAFRRALDAAASVVSDPIGENDFAFERLMFRHYITQRRAHPVDFCAQKIQITRPPEIFRAAADEILSVDILAGVELREERLNRHATRRAVAETDANLRDLARPLWLAEHLDHRVIHFVRRRWRKIDAARR
jgi:hypothetical protein